MERRDDSRNARHLPVRLWRRGEAAHLTGYTTNISPAGMFVASTQVLPSGSRVRVEVGTGRDSFIVEGCVARSIRSAPELSRLRLSGMGIRFMSVDALVGELVPTARKPSPPPEEQPATEITPPSTTSEPAHVPTAATTELTFRLSFASIAAFRTAFERDIPTGGLFVPSRKPAALRDIVTVEILVGGLEIEPVSVAARVVHRFEPTGADEAAARPAGMGVEFVDPAGALRLLRSLAGEAAIAELDRRDA